MDLVVVGAVMVVFGLLVALNVCGLADGVVKRHRRRLDREAGGYIESPQRARKAGWFVVGAGIFGDILALAVPKDHM
jgi:hypothetical protein